MYFPPLLRESKRHHDSAESSPNKAEQAGRLDSHPLRPPSQSSCAEARSQHVRSEQQESGGTVTIVPDAQALSSALHSMTSRAVPSTVLKTTLKSSLEHQSHTADLQSHFRVSTSAVKAVLASLGRPQMNQRHDGRVAVKQVLILDLATLLQDEVPGDYAVTPNFSVSKEAK